LTFLEASSASMKCRNESRPAGRGQSIQKPRTGNRLSNFCCACPVAGPDKREMTAKKNESRKILIECNFWEEPIRKKSGNVSGCKFRGKKT
jgi:hypothetical protein